MAETGTRRERRKRVTAAAGEVPILPANSFLMRHAGLSRSGAVQEPSVPLAVSASPQPPLLTAGSCRLGMAVVAWGRLGLVVVVVVG